jgi:hypothetical protein
MGMVYRRGTRARSAPGYNRGHEVALGPRGLDDRRGRLRDAAAAAPAALALRVGARRHRRRRRSAPARLDGAVSRARRSASATQATGIKLSHTTAAPGQPRRVRAAVATADGGIVVTAPT